MQVLSSPITSAADRAPGEARGGEIKPSGPQQSGHNVAFDSGAAPGAGAPPQTPPETEPKKTISAAFRFLSFVSELNRSLVPH